MKYKECNESMSAVNILCNESISAVKYKECNKSMTAVNIKCNESKAAVNKGVTINAQQT